MRLTKIKLLRLRKGLLQWELARRVGIGESQMSKIETARVVPADDVLKRIAEALEVPVAALLKDFKSQSRSEALRAD